VLTRGYPNIETFKKTGEVGTTFTGVHAFKDMLTAKVSSVSESAAAVDIVRGLTGAEVLDKTR
jgi:uncharacterized protein YunC (DUF1805 family)